MTKIDHYPEAFICPVCRAKVDRMGEGYHCSACDMIYPVLFGIPDFRIRPDRYLTLEQEREKAGKLYEFGKTATFSELLDFYYTITDDVPAELAVRYKAYINNAPRLAALTVKDLDLSPDKDVLLDVGCGAGGMLIAATGQCRAVIGVDIALRWLVICKKRLAESGIDAMLVCADAEALPFEYGKMTKIVAGDVIEHVYDPVHLLEVCEQHLMPAGQLWVSASNRYCLGPNALTRIWWIGFFPRPMRTRLLKRLRGVDSLRYINLVSPGYLKQLLGKTGLQVVRAGPRQVALVQGCDYPFQDRVLIYIYQLILKSRLLSHALMWIGPAFEIMTEKPVDRNVP
ncbi:MAG: methyltransferase domain-containing protein [Gammaproteobacteria bacterium]|nr:methyltransferase domain-containing protein [Gammaproteobacteria bacterium]